MKHALLAVLVCAACSSPAPPPPAAPPGTGRDLSMQVVRLEHAPAEAVARLVRDALAGQATGDATFRVVAQPEQNALVLSGTTAQIREALDIVARLDTVPAR